MIWIISVVIVMVIIPGGVAILRRYKKKGHVVICPPSLTSKAKGYLRVIEKE